MISDKELFTKASKAAHDYRMVHGSFPEKIGIHYKRLHQFSHRQIYFHEPTELPLACFAAVELQPFESVTYKRAMATFEPVVGEQIEWDEVYLPIPGDERNVISGAGIALLAQKKKRETEFLYHREGKHDDLYRIMQAERQEEVNVCPDCYGFYLPGRQLQEIYDPWFAPRCDYCEKPAKYHVHRSAWIAFTGTITNTAK